MKNEYENLLEADADTEVQQESGGKKRLSNGAVVLIVLAMLVCTPFCCLGWKRWAAHIDISKDRDSECSEMEAINHMHANRVSPDKLLPFERWIEKRPEQTAPVSPKVCPLSCLPCLYTRKGSDRGNPQSAIMFA